MTKTNNEIQPLANQILKHKIEKQIKEINDIQ